MSERIISTPCGFIKGCESKIPGITAYKGIRYATAERWEYPNEVKSWEGTYDATKFGPACFQPRSFYDESKRKEKAFYYKEFRKDEVYEYSEDCLFLNIFVKDGIKPGEKLPVIFYIHGGGFTGGCGYEKHFDTPAWATKNVVGVTINYRLGALGFACIKELYERDGHTGNYGLYDQIEALLWVKHNIDAFGGDPNNITIMGQSAGGMSVEALCTGELPEKLFERAVISSGCTAALNVDMKADFRKRFEFWDLAMKNAGCENLEEFMKISPKELHHAVDKTKKEMKAGMAESPCIDGILLKEKSSMVFKKGQQLEISYMVGSNSQDIYPPLFHIAAKKWCKNQLMDSYAYHFSHQLPGDEKGAWHSSDLWYWFGTYMNGWRPMTDEDMKLSEQMVGYLTNFAKTGNPNGDGLPEWNPANKKTPSVMEFYKQAVSVTRIKLLPLINTMLHNKAVGE